MSAYTVYHSLLHMGLHSCEGAHAEPSMLLHICSCGLRNTIAVPLCTLSTKPLTEALFQERGPNKFYELIQTIPVYIILILMG